MDKQKEIDNAVINLIDLSSTTRKKLFEVNLKKLLKLVEDKAYNEGRDKDRSVHKETKLTLESIIQDLRSQHSTVAYQPTYEQVYPRGKDSVID